MQYTGDIPKTILNDIERNVEVVDSSHIKGPVVSLPLLPSTVWFQERIRAWIHNRTKINWGLYRHVYRYCWQIQVKECAIAIQVLFYILWKQ